MSWIDKFSTNELKLKRVVIPFRCTSTGKIMWPGMKAYMSLTITKHYDGLTIRRVAMSSEEYMMKTLTNTDIEREVEDTCENSAQ